MIEATGTSYSRMICLKIYQYKIYKIKITFLCAQFYHSELEMEKSNRMRTQR